MRFPALDSVRGLAALVVVFWHAALVIYPPDKMPIWIMQSPAKLLISGPPAVILFFVLSGFVLSISFLYKGGEQYLPFVVKRISRIWLPFVAVILVSATASEFFAAVQVPEAGEWFQRTWSVGATIPNLLRHLAMTGTADDLDNPMWTLWHELRISLVFPVLVFAVTRRWKAILITTLVLAVLAMKVQSGLPNDTVLKSLVNTLAFVPLFVVGIILAMRHREISATISKLPPTVHGLMWVIGLFLIAGPFDGHMRFQYFRSDFVPGILLPGLGAAIITALTLTEGRALGALLGPVPLFLGRISYSLYLTHVVVFAIVIRIFHILLGVPGALALSIILAFPVAQLCNHFVEIPAMRIGRRVAAHLPSLRATTGARLS